MAYKARKIRHGRAVSAHHVGDARGDG
jgi:hypothetical protein